MERYLRMFLFPVAAFVILVLYTGYNNRYATDDFEFLIKLKEFGYTGSIVYFYDHWNTRWAAVGLANLVFIITEFAGTLFWYHLLSLLLLLFACFRICKSLITHVSVTKVLIIAGLMMTSFFYCIFSIPDVFYWINSSAMYLFGCIMFLLALGELLSGSKSPLSYALIIISGGLLGGMYEPLVLNAMIFIVIYLIYIFSKKGTVVIKNATVLKSIILLSVLMISFAVSYAGEGHLIRASFLPETTFLYKITAFAKALIKMFVIYLPLRFLLALALAFPWLLISTFHPFKAITTKVWLLSTLAFNITVATSLAPVVFIMSEMGPERAWSQIAIYLTAYSIITAIWIGNNLKSKFINIWCSAIVVILIFAYIVGTGVIAIQQDETYSAAYDERMLFIKNNDSVEGDTLELKSLPPTIWLHSAELSENSEHHKNQQIKKYLGLECEVVKSGTQ